MSMVLITVEEFKKALQEEVVPLRKEMEEISKKLPGSESWLTIEDTCKLLKVSRRTIQNYTAAGLLSYSKIQGRVYIKLSDIEDMLEKHYIKSYK